MLAPDGVGAVVELADTDATATLRGLYAQIGGRYVQPVQLAADLVMWVDEDGLLTAHPVMNRAATLLRPRPQPGVRRDRRLHRRGPTRHHAGFVR